MNEDELYDFLDQEFAEFAKTLDDYGRTDLDSVITAAAKRLSRRLTVNLQSQVPAVQ